LIVVLPMLFSVLTATRLPSRSVASAMSLPSGATTALKSAPTSPVVLLPAATMRTSMPLSLATSSEVLLEKPNSNWPDSTPGRMAAPPWPLSRVRSMPSSSKKPWSSPR
jgi:hypothetical protein